MTGRIVFHNFLTDCCIQYLDDTYLWTLFKHAYSKQKIANSHQENDRISELYKELFNRTYKKSIYKSLAEFDLFFEDYPEDRKRKLTKLFDDILENPYIESEKKDEGKYLSGYFNKKSLDSINQFISQKYESAIKNNSKDYCEDCKNLQLTELIYVSAGYKMKQLETLNTYIILREDIVPISQIPLLEEQIRKTEQKSGNYYFYLYYSTNLPKDQPPRSGEGKIIRKAIK